MEIVKEAEGRFLTENSKDDWIRETRPVVEAFPHAGCSSS